MRYCPYCGTKLEHKITTDANTQKVCKDPLCVVKLAKNTNITNERI